MSIASFYQLISDRLWFLITTSHRNLGHDKFQNYRNLEHVYIKFGVVFYCCNCDVVRGFRFVTDVHTILGNHCHRCRTQKFRYPMNVDIQEEVPKMREWQQTSMMYA